MNFKTNRKITAGLATILAVGIVQTAPVFATELGISDANYSLEALIEAARNEPPIVVVDATGKIKVMATNFSELYGIEATGVKLGGQEQELILQREYEAGNVKHDVFNMSNLPSITTQILPQGSGVSWMPSDLKDTTPAI